MPESVSFAEDSWETISAIVKAGKAEEYYNLGDTKEIILDGYTNGSESTFTVRIANMSTPAECSTEGFSQTACDFVVEFVDIIDSARMNGSGWIPEPSNKGGWPKSTMYDFINNDENSIYNALPSDLKKVIIDTYSVSGYGSGDSTNFTSLDKLYLLSTKEVWGKEGIGNTIDYDSAESETRQLDYYKNNGVTTDFYLEAIKTYHESVDGWWLRTAIQKSVSEYYSVASDGNWNECKTDSSYGIAPAFRIG